MLIDEMAMTSCSRTSPTTPRRSRVSVETIRLALLWLAGVSGAFVFIEPSPYELISLLTIAFFLASGLSLNARHVPLALLVIAVNLGFSISVLQVFGQDRTLIWVLVSWYLGATALFYAAMLGDNTEERLSFLLKGYMFAALVASSLAIFAYFRLFGGASEFFLRYDRARGPFNDPNVLGAFLVLPMLLAYQRILLGSTRLLLRRASLLAVLAVALLLTFSRGAWAQGAFALALLTALQFVASSSRWERVRIAGAAAMGVVALAAALSAVLSIDKVAELFEVRASLDQSYDLGHAGRFGRHALGFALALEKPFGIGPLQFSRFFPEDPHNSYLNAFMAGGWLSGTSYLALVLTTLAYGFRYAFVRTPWQRTYLAVLSAYVAAAAESVIIDSDHWRHYFLLLGLLWGLIVVSVPYRRARPLAAVEAGAAAALISHRPYDARGRARRPCA